MYIKQLRVMNRENIESLLFTLQKDSYTMVEIPIDKANAMVKEKPTQLPPYNACNTKTKDVTVKLGGINNKLRSLFGASANRSIKQMEQRVGYVDIAELKAGLPVFSCVCLDVNKQTGEQLIEGKLITMPDGKRYMYAMLHRLTRLQEKAGAGNITLGVINGRVMTQDLKYECICDFAISPAALAQLSAEEFGFIINTQAMQEYDYTLDDMPDNAVSKLKIQELVHKCNQHNNSILQTLKAKSSGRSV